MMRGRRRSYRRVRTHYMQNPSYRARGNMFGFDRGDGFKYHMVMQSEVTQVASSTRLGVGEFDLRLMNREDGFFGPEEKACWTNVERLNTQYQEFKILGYSITIHVFTDQNNPAVLSEGTPVFYLAKDPFGKFGEVTSGFTGYTVDSVKALPGVEMVTFPPSKAYFTRRMWVPAMNVVYDQMRFSTTFAQYELPRFERTKWGLTMTGGTDAPGFKEILYNGFNTRVLFAFERNYSSFGYQVSVTPHFAFRSPVGDPNLIPVLDKYPPKMAWSSSAVDRVLSNGTVVAKPRGFGTYIGAHTVTDPISWKYVGIRTDSAVNPADFSSATVVDLDAPSSDFDMVSKLPNAPDGKQKAERKSPSGPIGPSGRTSSKGQELAQNLSSLHFTNPEQGRSSDGLRREQSPIIPKSVSGTSGNSKGPSGSS